jgi:hypothetical protein
MEELCKFKDELMTDKTIIKMFFLLFGVIILAEVQASKFAKERKTIIQQVSLK